MCALISYSQHAWPCLYYGWKVAYLNAYSDKQYTRHSQVQILRENNAVDNEDDTKILSVFNSLDLFGDTVSGVIQNIATKN